MKATVLSAGQGKCLPPLTVREPKRLLPMDGTRTVLEVQLQALERTIRNAPRHQRRVVIPDAADAPKRVVSA